jgi:hypothetical protein
MVTRTASEIKGRGKFVLLQVNEAEEKKIPPGGWPPNVALIGNFAITARNCWN